MTLVINDYSSSIAMRSAFLGYSNTLTTTALHLTLKFSSYIHGLQMINHDDFRKNLFTFPLRGSSGHIYYLSSSLVYDLIPAKLVTVLSVSVVTYVKC